MPEERLEAVNQLENSAQKPAARSLLLDVVRGLAISMVALGHTDQGAEHRGWWGASLAGARLENFIYAIHMPAFFFVSGIFLASSVAKRGPKKFIDAKVAQLIYPYFLWSLFGFLGSYPLRSFTSQDVLGPKAFLLLTLSGGTLWFLPAVFFCMLLGMILRRANMAVVFAGAVAVALLPVKWQPEFVQETIVHFPFLVAGMWVSRRYERLDKLSLPLAAAGALVLGVAIYFVANGPYYRVRPVNIALGLAGTAMLFLVARCFRKDAFARTMAWVGEASFGVYILAAYAQGLGREMLLRGLHTTEPYVQLIFPTLLAIFIPAWIYQHRIRLKVGWLFLWPF